MIKSAEELVFSRAAAARILGITVEQIKRVEVWVYVVLVVPHAGHGLRPRFVSKQAFKVHFAEFRRQSALGLLVTSQRGHEFRVLNPKNNNQYKVRFTDKACTCECEDYKNQVKFLGRGCCKHAYRVLFHLGFKSLAEYVSSRAAQRLRILLNSG